MKLRHTTTTGTHELATTVEVADSLLQKALGLMGRKSLPDGYALVFQFARSQRRTIHMLGVRTALDVLWVEDDTVTAVETLPAWRGLARAQADMIVELPPGAAEHVAVGDEITLVA